MKGLENIFTNFLFPWRKLSFTDFYRRAVDIYSILRQHLAEREFLFPVAEVSFIYSDTNFGKIWDSRLSLSLERGQIDSI